MYNTKHICCYFDENIFTKEEIATLTENEQAFVLNCLYRNDLLHIFEIDDFEKCREQIIDELYDKLKHSSFFLSCMNQLNKKYNIFEEEREENNMLGLVLLYSFDYLYLAHLCVCEFLETGIVSEKNSKLLKEKVFG
jgi:hypothetical protein